MAKFEKVEDMVVWQKARVLTRDVYKLARGSKLSGEFSLRDQICRAALSVMSNIAEGFERDGNKEFIQMLSCAKGSCGEVRSQLYAVSDLGLISSEQFTTLYSATVEIGRMLSSLIAYLRKSAKLGRKYKN